MTSNSTVPVEIEEALALHGCRPTRIELISPLKERKGMRMAYKIERAGDPPLKARLCVSEDEARNLLALRAPLELAFAPIITRHGAVLLEEWIDGEMLDEKTAERHVDEAGALLGRLHTQALPSGRASSCVTEPWRTAADSDIELLTGAGCLRASDADLLRRRLTREDPQQATRSLVHRDFCAENFLIDGHGRLRVIDNEAVGVGPRGFDLGWTFHRWPMSDGGWSRFLGAYESVAGAPEALRFWQLAAALLCTRVFLQRMPERLEASVARLRPFIRGDEGEART